MVTPLLFVLLTTDEPALRPVADVPGLPRVLLIGDSISIGYTIGVRERLAGRANVHRIAENGGPTTRGLERIEAWLGDGRWDVIHLNFGLHDLKVMDEAGTRQVPLTDYGPNLERLFGRLEQTGASLIWASTTPVPEGKVNPVRHPEDVVRYNAVAAEIAARHGVLIDDLYSLALPRLGEWQQPVNVHFQPAGYAALAEQVAESIATALAERAERPQAPGPVRRRRHGGA